MRFINNYKTTILKKIFLLIFLLWIAVFCNGQSHKDTILELMSTMIYFDSNDATIDSAGKISIKAIIDTLPALRSRIYNIEAHTDGDGSIDFNQKLSDKRAQTIFNTLKDFGIEAHAITISSFGKSKPDFSNHSEVGKSKNRRVKLSLRSKFIMKMLQGRLEIGDTTIRTAMIRFKDNIFLDSVFTDEKGNFSIFLPINRRLVYSVHGSDLFAEPQIIFTRNEAFVQPLKVKANMIRPNSILAMKEINFQGGKDVILPESTISLEYLLQYMLQNVRICFEIAGHINFPGKVIPKIIGPASDEINKRELSHRRAQAIFNYLIEHGINEKRMQFKGYSNRMMKFPNPTNEDEAKANRRVEIIIKDCTEVFK